MTRAQFAYSKDRSADEIVRHIKDIIANATEFKDNILSFLFLSSDYSPECDTISGKYIPCPEVD